VEEPGIVRVEGDREEGGDAGAGIGPAAVLSGDPAGKPLLDELQALLHPYLEAYAIALRASEVLRRERLKERELAQRTFERARSMYMTEEVKRKEATSHITLRSALRRLRALGVVQEDGSSEGSREALLSLDEARWEAFSRTLTELLGG
jgi:hypothetical protein